MKVSDFIIRRLEEHGVRDVFLLSGGGMMHLLDSLAQSEKIHPWYTLHEQAAAVCAEAASQVNGQLGVCMVTSGPGATNAITGAVNAWIDSDPVLVISGQAKTSDLVGDRGVRQTGSQEVNITAMMRCASNYAVTIQDKKMVKYHLDKAIYLATHGRKGTVWVDVPLDIQGAQVEEDTLTAFDPAAEGLVPTSTVSEGDLDDVLQLLRTAKRPLVLAGKGVLLDQAAPLLREFCRRLQIPALATCPAKMVFADEDPLYFGQPGSPAPRYSNWIVQSCDLLLTVGSRLNTAVTVFDETRFASQAKQIIVDIDKNEIAKLRIPFAKALVCGARDFLARLNARVEDMAPLDTAKWLEYCRAAKAAYPIWKERQPNPQSQVNAYLFGHLLSNFICPEDVHVYSSTGRASVISAICYERKEGQAVVDLEGLGSMGFALPAAIGACIASGKRRTVVIDGDGSMQHNLQELALIRGYGLPIKLFVLNNGGYSSISVMQDHHFHGRHAGCDAASGVFLCDMKKAAGLYGLRYDVIRGDEEIEPVLRRVMADDEPVLCEFFVDRTFDEIPKAVSRVNPDGTMTSSSLEDLFPFLPKEETQRWMRAAEDAK